MIRSIRALPVLLILAGMLLAPAAVEAQEASTHEVERGETLWSIAIDYYGDGHLWQRIWDANRDRLDDPGAIEVGLMLTIPPRDGMEGDAMPEAEQDEGAVTGVTVMTEEEMARETAEPARAERPMPPQEARGPKQVRRTVMFPDTARLTRPVEELTAELPPIAEDEVYSAAWLRPVGAPSPTQGEIVGFVGAEGQVADRRTARPYDRVRLSVEGAGISVGTRLLVFREDHALAEGRGVVMVPTGTVEVVDRDEAGVVARVESLYDQMQLGDRVRALPPYRIREGQRVRPYQGPPVDAELVAFAGERAIHSLNEVIFLDVSEAEGIRVGDEFSVVYASGEGWEGQVEGRAIVVRLDGPFAAARITHLSNPVFVEGVRLRLTGRIQ